VRDPKLENLLRSPYDDQSARPDAMAWKAPVGAAILGALAMSAYVIFAVVAGPTEDIDTTTSVLQVQAVQATGFPQGYAPVSDDVAIRADMMQARANGTTLFVSSVTRGGDASDSIAPVEFADWTVNSAGSEPVMLHQHAAKGVLAEQSKTPRTESRCRPTCRPCSATTRSCFATMWSSSTSLLSRTVGDRCGGTSREVSLPRWTLS